MNELFTWRTIGASSQTQALPTIIKKDWLLSCAKEETWNLFLTTRILPKKNSKIHKFIIKEIMDNIGFWKWETLKLSNLFGLQYVTINIKGWLNIYIPYLVYNQIWLNISRDKLSFFLHLPMDNCDLGCT